MNRYVAPFIVLLSYATFAQIKPGELAINQPLYHNSNSIDEARLDSLLDVIFDPDSAQDYRDIISNPHVMKELRFTAPLSVEEFEHFVINPPTHDLSPLSDIANEIIQDSLYTSMRTDDGLDSIRIKRDDLGMSLKVRLVYEESLLDKGNHLLIYVGDYTLFDYPVNIWPITLYPDLNAHGITIVNYSGNSEKVDFTVKIFAEAHNWVSKIFGSGDTEPMPDSTQKKIQDDINAIIGQYNKAKEEQRVINRPD